MMDIAIALSGGVDSVSAAKRLLAAGHHVIGLTLRLCPSSSGSRLGSGLTDCPGLRPECTCARAVNAANGLGIEHQIIDARDEFEKKVIQPFIQGYIHGSTPNPCALCNREIKFGLLLQAAQAVGASRLATGHYAAIKQDISERWWIHRATDRLKDQTYFLALIPPGCLPDIDFPLAAATKSEVRREESMGKERLKSSTEICFLKNRPYTQFLKQRVPEAFRPGFIVDRTGRRLGEHAGLPNYTVGQRRGLGVAGAHPAYVVALRPRQNEVVIGPDRDLWKATARLHEVNWFGEPPAPNEPIEAQIRYRQLPVSGRVHWVGGQPVIHFDHLVRAVTPGQVVAIYQNKRLVGGGKITPDEEGA